MDRRIIKLVQDESVCGSIMVNFNYPDQLHTHTLGPSCPRLPLRHHQCALSVGGGGLVLGIRRMSKNIVVVWSFSDIVDHPVLLKGAREWPYRHYGIT